MRYTEFYTYFKSNFLVSLGVMIESMKTDHNFSQSALQVTEI